VAGTGESKKKCPWGELLSTAAMARGAGGAVIDGLVRDVRKILALGFRVCSPAV
jgi:regulator of RNase E activity RraA